MKYVTSHLFCIQILIRHFFQVKAHLYKSTFELKFNTTWTVYKIKWIFQIYFHQFTWKHSKISAKHSKISTGSEVLQWCSTILRFIQLTSMFCIVQSTTCLQPIQSSLSIKGCLHDVHNWIFKSMRCRNVFHDKKATVLKNKTLASAGASSSVWLRTELFD